mmetsp:Transcript_44329/g.118283  ORF Transcript_44329/g.118283 Transcript_44329/m.118283 type:complete len:259 (-) Transcript_44329:2031-2807(-)
MHQVRLRPSRMKKSRASAGRFSSTMQRKRSNSALMEKLNSSVLAERSSPPGLMRYCGLMLIEYTRLRMALACQSSAISRGSKSFCSRLGDRRQLSSSDIAERLALLSAGAVHPMRCAHSLDTTRSSATVQSMGSPGRGPDKAAAGPRRIDDTRRPLMDSTVGKWCCSTTTGFWPAMSSDSAQSTTRPFWMRICRNFSSEREQALTIRSFHSVLTSPRRSLGVVYTSVPAPLSSSAAAISHLSCSSATCSTALSVSLPM